MISRGMARDSEEDRSAVGIPYIYSDSIHVRHDDGEPCIARGESPRLPNKPLRRNCLIPHKLAEITNPEIVSRDMAI